MVISGSIRLFHNPGVSSAGSGACMWGQDRWQCHNFIQLGKNHKQKFAFDI